MKTAPRSGWTLVGKAAGAMALVAGLTAGLGVVPSVPSAGASTATNVAVPANRSSAPQPGSARAGRGAAPLRSLRGEHVAARTPAYSGDEGLSVDAFVSCPSAAVCESAGSGISRSTDGGKTWVTQALPLTYAGFTSISCATTTACVAVGDGNPGAPTPLAFWTTDGTTWTAGTLPSGGLTTLSSVSCPTASVCIASGISNGSPVIVATSDGGRTWTLDSGTVTPGLYKVACLSTSDCFGIVGESTDPLSASTDGGLNWSPVALPGNPTGLNGLSCPVGTSVCVAVTSSTAEVLGSGGTWSAVTLPTTSTGYFSVACDPTGAECLALSQHAEGAVSTDSGSTWTATSGLPQFPGNRYVQSLSCGAPGVCAGGGSGGNTGGFFIATADGGSTWTYTETPTLDGAPLYGTSVAADTELVVPVQEVAGSPGTSFTLAAAPSWLQIYTYNDTSAVVFGVAPPSAQPGFTYTVVATNAGGSVGETVPVSVTPPPPGTVLAGPVVGMAQDPYSGGYWLVGNDGAVSPHGGAPYLGSMKGTPLNAPIVGMAPDEVSGGYWLVASDGGIFSFGGAPFYGSMGGQHLNKPIVGIAQDIYSGGYWMVASDGGIFSFGGAPFYGSMGGTPLNAPVVGMAQDAYSGGYWLVASDGGIFSFGGAPFYGSMGGKPLNEPVVGMAQDLFSGGYWMVASDGGIFSFGGAPFYGSMGGKPLALPMVGMAQDLGSGGYWTVAADGGIFSFGGAPFLGAH